MLRSLASTVRVHDSVASLDGGAACIRSAGSDASGLLSIKTNLHPAAAVSEVEVELEVHEHEGGGREQSEQGPRAHEKQREQQRRRRADDFPLDPALIALLPPHAILKSRRRSNAGGARRQPRFGGVVTTFLWAFAWVWRTNRDGLFRCLFIIGLECVDHYYTPVVTAKIFEPVSIMRGSLQDLWLRPFGLLFLAALHLAEVELAYRFDLYMPAGAKFSVVAQMALVNHIMRLPAESLDCVDFTKLLAVVQTDVEGGEGGGYHTTHSWQHEMRPTTHSIHIDVGPPCTFSTSKCVFLFACALTLTRRPRRCHQSRADLRAVGVGAARSDVRRLSLQLANHPHHPRHRAHASLYNVRRVSNNRESLRAEN